MWRLFRSNYNCILKLKYWRFLYSLYVNLIANQYHDDSIQITEEDPCCFRLFKRCGTFSGHIKARGREIRVSFISDRTITRKGFSFYWKGTTVMYNCFIIAIQKIFFISQALVSVLKCKLIVLM